ncbi:MAG: cysteine desulfurase-like protein [Candidatus Limnocylindrales bacterium]
MSESTMTSEASGGEPAACLPTAFDVDRLRARFPALEIEQDSRPVVFLDGPGGTQVPDSVIAAMTQYLRAANANAGGAFLTSRRSDAILHEAHVALADLLNASSPNEIKFGPNMTTLTLALSRAIGATLRPGDELIVTTLDHEADISPWRRIAADQGLIVRTVDIDPSDCTLDLGSLDGALNERTRLVAVGYASNALGTINPVGEIVRRAHAFGALAFIDAVHFAPHGLIDVQALGADFLACSVYKFLGPHVGVLSGRAELLETLPAYKVRPAHDRWETGTQNHEGLAGTVAAVEYLANIGRTFGAAPAEAPHATGVATARRRDLEAALLAIAAYERALAGRLLEGLAAIAGLQLWGITDHARLAARTPTVALRLAGWSPRGLAEALAARGVFAWDGDFYATSLMERLGLAESGGVVRLGLAHYNTAGEVERVVADLAELAGAPQSERR